MKKVINLGIRIMIACIYLYGGWLFFKINYTDHQKLEKLKTEGIATEAVVTNVVQSITGPRPEVAFTSPDRQETRFTGFCNHEVQAGQKVAVVYHPKNYQEAALQADIEGYPRTFTHSVFGSAIFCAICIIVAAYTMFSKGFTFQLK